MNHSTLDEAEQVYTWLTSHQDPLEQENAMNWLTSIGSGAAQGATTGAVAGPWGALIGGLLGAGLGAVQQATQQSAPQRPSPQRPPPAARPRPTPQSGLRPAPPPQQSAPSTPLTSGVGNTAAIQQIAQLLPQLVLLIQAIQPALASAQQGGSTGEDISETSRIESLAGDVAPDKDFATEQASALFEMEFTNEGEDYSEVDDEEDHIEWPLPAEHPYVPSPPVEPGLQRGGGVILPPPGTMFNPLPPILGVPSPFPILSSEWTTEAESFVMQPTLQWVS